MMTIHAPQKNAQMVSVCAQRHHAMIAIHAPLTTAIKPLDASTRLDYFVHAEQTKIARLQKTSATRFRAMVFALKNRLIAMTMTHALWIGATEQRAVCTRKSVIATVAKAQMTALHLLMLAQSRSARMVHVASSQRFAMTKTFAPRIHA
jgi:hypothetical protein